MLFRSYVQDLTDELCESYIWPMIKSGASDEIHSATFESAKRNRAYEETSVDRYLARVVEVLLSVE